jgi:predicted MFS family arabinose efflux permease
MLFALVLVAQGRDAEQFDPRQPMFGFIGFFTGGACSLLGGYVCARLARRNERRVTAIMASLSAAVPVALVLVVALQHAVLPVLSLGWSAVRLALMFLLAIAGGELGRRRNLTDARNTAAASAA